ncbi:MAG: four helix bundle protein [Oscillospiraceae bacterium]|nr:four helix bundle protein [Oscillospiraceae bacterium]
MMENIVEENSFRFAVRIVKLCQYLRSSKKEYALTKQLIRSGTSVGANVAEAQQAQSKADFVSKLNIALKEAVETNYWIRLLAATNYLTETEKSSILEDCEELQKILISIIKKSKQ